MIRVAIADDDTIILRGMRKLIDWESLGYEISGTANNGQELLRLCEREEIDVVITDIEMPRLNGFETIDLINMRYPNIKVIIISGYERFDYAKKAIERGAIHYLLKPIYPEELATVLIKLKKTIKKQKEDTAWNKQMFDQAHSLFRKEVYSTNQIIDMVLEEINRNIMHDLKLETISERYHINPNYFSRIFKEYVGENFVAYKTNTKIKYAKWLLSNTAIRVCEVAANVGYEDMRYFGRVFKKNTGCTPLEYKAQNSKRKGRIEKK